MKSEKIMGIEIIITLIIVIIFRYLNSIQERKFKLEMAQKNFCKVYMSEGKHKVWRPCETK